MMFGRVALLMGLFVAPALLLYLAHHLRLASDTRKRRFWGALCGHVAGLLLATAAMMTPPVWWSGGSVIRDLTVHWAMVVGFAVGWLVAPLTAGKDG